jgi:N,N'-diacetyllegionaminate synthase
MQIKINHHTISENSKTFLVGEIGLNHDGKISKCKKLIDNAKIAGFDAVKLQISDPNESYYPNSPSFKTFKKYSLKIEDLKKIVKYAKKKKIVIFSTFGDLKSLKYQDKFQFPIIKVSSGLITNIPLIRKIAKKNKPIILSSGLAYLNDIRSAIKEIKKFNKKGIVLLVCTSLYPCKDKYINLSRIISFKKKFKLLTGFSDHSLDNFSSVSSVLLGSKVIEKHITLKKIKRGDHFISADKKQMIDLVRDVRRAESIMGKKKIGPTKPEIKIRSNILRKIVTKTKILKGQLFSFKNIALMRHSKKINKLELNNKFFDRLIGKKNKKTIDKFTVLTKQNF